MNKKNQAAAALFSCDSTLKGKVSNAWQAVANNHGVDFANSFFAQLTEGVCENSDIAYLSDRMFYIVCKLGKRKLQHYAHTLLAIARSDKFCTNDLESLLRTWGKGTHLFPFVEVARAIHNNHSYKEIKLFLSALEQIHFSIRGNLTEIVLACNLNFDIVQEVKNFISENKNAAIEKQLNCSLLTILSKVIGFINGFYPKNYYFERQRRYDIKRTNLKFNVFVNVMKTFHYIRKDALKALILGDVPQFADRVEALQFLYFTYNDQPLVFLQQFEYLQNNELEWFMTVVSGKPITASKTFNIPLTKKEVHFFNHASYTREKYLLYNNDRWIPIRQNVLYCKFMYRGINEELLHELIFTQLFPTYSHHTAELWDKLIDIFVCGQKAVESHQIRPLVDFVYQEVFDRHPDFSLKGKTYQSLCREMNAWHLELQRFRNPLVMQNAKWKGLNVATYNFENEQSKYVIVQLLSAKELFEEGKNLNHCVSSYAYQCIEHKASIFSLRLQKTREAENEHRLITIQISNNCMVQARGKHNRMPSSVEKYIISKWCKLNNFAFVSC